MKDENPATEPRNMNEPQSMLTAEAIRAIGASLREARSVADVFALYMTTKNFHWDATASLLENRIDEKKMDRGFSSQVPSNSVVCGR
jgi:hypothetical protein